MWIAFVLVPVVGVALLLFLTIRMPGRSFRGTPQPATEAESESARRLKETVHRLTVDIGERNEFRFSALEAAADWLEVALGDMGYEVARHTYAHGANDVANLEVVCEGTVEDAGTMVVGGHYDSVLGTVGADDNASGAAAVLELARLLRDRPFRHRVRFVLFVNEEPPNFKTDSMGSRVYARSLADRGERVVAMLALETIGYFTATPGSQRYPFPFSLFYPGRGDFIGIVGNMRSRSLVHRLVRAFRDRADFPSEGIAAPSIVPGVGWSDHWSFWKSGFPAVMITDTAPFRNPHYHLPTDTIETLDFESMAKIVHGLAAALADLDREES